MNKRIIQFILFMLCGLATAGVLAGTGLVQDWKAIRQEERSREAGALFKEIQGLHTSMKLEQVKTKMNELVTKYPEVKRARGYVRMAHALEYIGRDTPNLEVMHWYQGETNLGHSRVNLLVFWESWCPHCQDSMPIMQQYHNKFQEKGLQIIGLTRVIEPSSTSEVMTFIAERNLTIPIGKVSHDVAESFGVDGVPSAAILKDGKIIWCGNPDQVKEETLNLALAD